MTARMGRGLPYVSCAVNLGYKGHVYKAQSIINDTYPGPNRENQCEFFCLYRKLDIWDEIRPIYFPENLVLNPLLPIVAYTHTSFSGPISSVGNDVMATES